MDDTRIINIYDVIKEEEKQAEKYKTLGFNENTKYNTVTQYGAACYRNAVYHAKIAEMLKELAEYRAADLVNREELSAEHSKHCMLNCYYYGYHKWDKEKTTTYCELIRKFGKPQESK